MRHYFAIACVLVACDPDDGSPATDDSAFDAPLMLGEQGHSGGPALTSDVDERGNILVMTVDGVLLVSGRSVRETSPPPPVAEASIDTMFLGPNGVAYGDYALNLYQPSLAYAPIIAIPQALDQPFGDCANGYPVILAQLADGTVFGAESRCSGRSGVNAVALWYWRDGMSSRALVPGGATAGPSGNEILYSVRPGRSPNEVLLGNRFGGVDACWQLVVLDGAAPTLPDGLCFYGEHNAARGYRVGEPWFDNIGGGHTRPVGWLKDGVFVASANESNVDLYTSDGRLIQGDAMHTMLLELDNGRRAGWSLIPYHSGGALRLLPGGRVLSRIFTDDGVQLVLDTLASDAARGRLTVRAASGPRADFVMHDGSAVTTADRRLLELEVQGEPAADGEVPSLTVVVTRVSGAIASGDVYPFLNLPGVPLNAGATALELGSDIGIYKANGGTFMVDDLGDTLTITIVDGVMVPLAGDGETITLNGTLTFPTVGVR